MFVRICVVAHACGDSTQESEGEENCELGQLDHTARSGPAWATQWDSAAELCFAEPQLCQAFFQTGALLEIVFT